MIFKIWYSFLFFYLDDDNEELVIDPPDLWVKFNCYSNILHVTLEWLSKVSNEYPLAFTIVDLNKNDVKFEWTINMEKIEEQPTNPYVDLCELFGLSRILCKYDVFIKF